MTATGETKKEDKEQYNTKRRTNEWLRVSSEINNNNNSNKSNNNNTINTNNNNNKKNSLVDENRVAEQLSEHPLNI